MIEDETGATRRRRNARQGLLAYLAGLTLLLAACGGHNQAESGTGSAQNLSQRLDAYASCVRAHGVPGFYISRAGTAPPSPSTVQAVFHGWLVPVNPSQSAQKACQHLLPTHTLPTGPELRQQFRQALKSAKCMRSHGYPGWPDPVIHNGIIPNVVPTGIDLNSPQFQAAAKSCGL